MGYLSNQILALFGSTCECIWDVDWAVNVAHAQSQDLVPPEIRVTELLCQVRCALATVMFWWCFVVFHCLKDCQENEMSLLSCIWPQ